jgi:hypothetical protein
VLTTIPSFKNCSVQCMKSEFSVTTDENRVRQCHASSVVRVERNVRRIYQLNVLFMWKASSRVSSSKPILSSLLPDRLMVNLYMQKAKRVQNCVLEAFDRYYLNAV